MSSTCTLHIRTVYLKLTNSSSPPSHSLAVPDCNASSFLLTANPHPYSKLLTMKFSTAVLFLSTIVGTASAMRATPSLMKVARRLEEAQQAEEEEFAFLGNYKLKMLACKSGEKYVDPEDGSYEYSSVVFRLCPADSCSDDSSKGCSSGYGDFVVGLNSFVQAYLEDKRDDMQQDDNFKVEEFGECREYKADQDGDNGDEEAVYYVGPACSADGIDIVLDMFTEETCTTQSEVTFESISAGLSLPYTTGGLVSHYCESCMGYNDNGEQELSEMCQGLYENSGKCESGMETFHYSGQNEASCEFIESLLPKQKKSGAGKAIGWIFFILVVAGVGAVGYSVIKKKRGSDDKSFGLMA